MDRLAIEGGKPVRTAMLPYARQSLSPEDVTAVTEALKSDWLTSGPLVEKFEQEFAERVGAKYAVSCSSGTAGLNLAYAALGLGSGDEIVAPVMTMAATTNAAMFLGAQPRLTDVDERTLLLDPGKAAGAVTPRTKAIVAVDYAGQACDYEELQMLADKKGLKLVADACHSLGGKWRDRPVGTLADLSVFSFHPVKHITTGEGGMVTTNDAGLADKLRLFRNHGISSDFRQREKRKTWKYEVVELGYNYRLTEFQAALGRSQLGRLQLFLARRRQIAETYDRALKETGYEPVWTARHARHAYHLYVVKMSEHGWSKNREDVFSALRAEGIGVNVHYIPLHMHPLYRQRLGYREGDFPAAEGAYQRLLTLPLFPSMTDSDVQDVISALRKVWAAYGGGK